MAQIVILHSKVKEVLVEMLEAHPEDILELQDHRQGPVTLLLYELKGRRRKMVSTVWHLRCQTRSTTRIQSTLSRESESTKLGLPRRMIGETEILPEGHGLLHEVASHLHHHQPTGINNRRHHVDQILPLRCSNGPAIARAKSLNPAQFRISWSNRHSENLEQDPYSSSQVGMLECCMKNLLHAVRQ